MDPISLALGIGGLGLQVAGAYMGAQGASAANEAAIKQIGLEQQGEAVKNQMMHTQLRRQSMEELRKAQRMSALAQNNATTQGAQFGSGLQGGLAQISGQSNTNQETLSLSGMFGDQMFDINRQISQQRVAQAEAGMTQQFGNSLGQAGRGVIGTIPMANQLAGGFNPFGNPTNVGSTTRYSA